MQNSKCFRCRKLQSLDFSQSPKYIQEEYSGRNRHKPFGKLSMKAVMLSIKPKFAHKIFDGSKKFEFRKQLFKDSSVKKVIVYSSSPEKKVIGEFEIEAVLSDIPDKIWERTKLHSGISKEFYNEYFKGCSKAYAIKIAKTKTYRKPKFLVDYNIRSAPQSFAYVEA